MVTRAGDAGSWPEGPAAERRDGGGRELSAGGRGRGDWPTRWRRESEEKVKDDTQISPGFMGMSFTEMALPTGLEGRNPGCDFCHYL